MCSDVVVNYVVVTKYYVYVWLLATLSVVNAELIN